MGWARLPHDLRGRNGPLLWAGRILLLSQVASITAARHQGLDVEQPARPPVGSSSGDVNETHLGELKKDTLELAELLADEIEYELDPNVLRRKNKLVLAMMEIALLGICGVDRCYMGQVCLGVLKGMTLGGVFVWFIIDWVAVFIMSLTWSSTVDMVGYKAVFNGGVDAAFWLTLCLSVLTFSMLVFKIFFINGQCENEKLPDDDLWMFDRDGSGYITKPELKKVLLQNDVLIADDEVNELFRELDKHNSGRISIHQLQTALRKL